MNVYDPEKVRCWCPLCDCFDCFDFEENLYVFIDIENWMKGA